MTKTSPKVYFPGLNGLRFLAAYAVIITHIELLKGVFGYTSAWKHPIIYNLGGLGVYFFFVLSGFLITYLLFTERKTTNTISVKAFYFRRIFRIWPLYYLVFIIGFLVLIFFNNIDIVYLANDFKNHYWFQFITYLFILPNLGYSFFGPVPHIGQLWSIGIEEQYYLIWPLLIKKSKNPLKLFFGLIIGLIFIKGIILILSTNYLEIRSLQIIKNFFAMLKIECMAIGAIGAYVLFYKKNYVIKLIFNPIIYLASWVMIPILIYYTPNEIQDGIHILYSVLFIIIIINISSNNKSFFKMENRLFEKLGQISYGMYMYHMMIIPMVLVFLNLFKEKIQNEIFLNIIIYFMVTFITLLISFLSYYYFEMFFLKLKKKFSIVQSGEK